jgi:ABC-2 type transport system ATP-binding protein
MIHTVELQKVGKSFGSFAVLRNLTLRVAEGQSYALLGGHGAGKTTLVYLLLGFLKPTSGRLRLLGRDNLENARLRVGYMPERMRYHLRYTARDYLRFLGYFSDLHDPLLRRRVNDLLKRVGLGNVADHRLSSFSRGMLQRLGVAQALLTNPELLLIDEPLSMLDSAEQRDIVELLADVRAQGYPLIICSHYFQAMTRLVDRVGVLAHGTLTDETHVSQLTTTSENVRILVDQLPPALREQIEQLSSAIESTPQTVVLRPNSQPLQAQVLRFLIDNGVSVRGLEPLEKPLEQFYMQALQRSPAAQRSVPIVPTPRPKDLDAALNEYDQQYGSVEEEEANPLLDSLLLERQNTQPQHPESDLTDEPSSGTSPKTPRYD